MIRARDPGMLAVLEFETRASPGAIEPQRLKRASLLFLEGAGEPPERPLSPSLAILA